MSAYGRGDARGCVESLHARTPSSGMSKEGMSRDMVFMVTPGVRGRVRDHHLHRGGVGEGRRSRGEKPAARAGAAIVTRETPRRDARQGSADEPMGGTGLEPVTSGM